MKRQLLINIALHALAIALYGVLNDIAVDWYKGHYGGFTARGVASGSIVFLVMWVFVPLNVVLPLLTNWKLKYWLVAAQVALILWWLLPEHPVRAYFFSCLAGGLSLAAVLVSHWLKRK